MTTTHVALITEAKAAMDGTTEGKWASHEGCLWIGKGQYDGKSTARICHGDKEMWFSGKDVCDAHFIAWAGNGGVRRLVEANEALMERLRKLEGLASGRVADAVVCGLCREPRVNGTPGHAADCPFAILNEEATDGG